MALMFPWATKEYLLWEMDLGQIVAYHNVGLKIKYGKPDKPERLQDMNYKQLKEYRDKMREQYGDIG